MNDEEQERKITVIEQRQPKPPTKTKGLCDCRAFFIYELRNPVKK